jgi:hypothetical protein
MYETSSTVREKMERGREQGRKRDISLCKNMLYLKSRDNADSMLNFCNKKVSFT